jgi:hypothetical protein
LLQYCRTCFPDTLDKNLVKGKIVLCDGLGDGEGPLLAGAVGTVYQGRRSDVAFSFPLPASSLRPEDGASVYLYVNTTRYKSKITWTMKKFRKHVYTKPKYERTRSAGDQLRIFVGQKSVKMHLPLTFPPTHQGVQILLHPTFSR